MEISLCLTQVNHIEMSYGSSSVFLHSGLEELQSEQPGQHIHVPEIPQTGYHITMVKSKGLWREGGFISVSAFINPNPCYSPQCNRWIQINNWRAPEYYWTKGDCKGDWAMGAADEISSSLTHSYTLREYMNDCQHQKFHFKILLHRKIFI